MSFCSGLFQEHLMRKLGLQLNPFSFDNHLKITLLFGRKRPKKHRFWQLYFINHVKNSESSPTAKIFSHLEDIMPTNSFYYQSKDFGPFFVFNRQKTFRLPIVIQQIHLFAIYHGFDQINRFFGKMSTYNPRSFPHYSVFDIS